MYFDEFSPTIPLRGGLTSFGANVDGKAIKRTPFTLQGNAGAGWVTFASDTYAVRRKNGHVLLKSQDASDNVLDWQSYLDYQYLGNVSFRATYSVKASGVVTTYTNETVTIAEVDSVNASDGADNDSGEIDGELAQNLFVQEIHAEFGDIGGWEIDSDTITGGAAILDSAGILTLGTGDDMVILDASDATYRIRAGVRYQYGQQMFGYATLGDFPFRVTKTGTLYSTLGYIGGWTIGATTLSSGGMVFNSDTERITLGTSAPQIILDGYYKSIQSSDFASGISGFNINARTGDAEFNNIAIRGALRASVFKVDEVSATAGTLGVFYSASTVYEDFTTPSATSGSYAFKARNSDVGVSLFAVGDIVRVKGFTGAAVIDAWSTITAGGTTGDGFSSTYVATLNSGSTSATIPAGTAIVDYGPSGTGFITLSADGTVGSSPNMTMASHAGSPWTTQTLLLRTGNLNGSYGYVADTYGFATGQYGTASKTSITIEQTNGIRILNNTTVVGQWDTSGNITLGTNRISLQADGDVFVGSDITLPDSTYFSVFTNAQTYNTESMSAGNVMIGSNSSSHTNILMHPTTGLKFRSGAIETATMVPAGTQFLTEWGAKQKVVSIGSGAIDLDNGLGVLYCGYITIDVSTGVFNLRGIKTPTVDGARIIVHNGSANDMTLTNSGSPGAGYSKLFTFTAADVPTTGAAISEFVYNTLNTRWDLVSTRG